MTTPSEPHIEVGVVDETDDTVYYFSGTKIDVERRIDQFNTTGQHVYDYAAPSDDTVREQLAALNPAMPTLSE